MFLKINTNHRRLKDSFEIELPDFVIITGTNGSGKSQLFNSLMGTYEMDSYPPSRSILKDESGVVYHHMNVVHPNQFYPSGGDNQTDEQEIISYQRHLQICQLLSTQKAISDSFSIEDLTTLNDTYKSIVLNPYGLHNDNLFRQITKEEVQLIATIAEKAGKEFDNLKYWDFIIYSPMPSYGLFSVNLTKLFRQFLYKEKYYPEKVKNETPPWITFNSILKRGKLPYQIAHPTLESVNASNLLGLQGQEVRFDELSSGEKTIMSLIFALYNSDINTDKNPFPQIILFDEPDSSLHPSMTQDFLDVIQQVFVRDNGVKVIMSTHSPSTIALSPELSIYAMTDGSLAKIEKNKAIKLLTEGLNTLTILYENRKQVFVEADFDVIFYENLVQLLMNEYLNKDIVLTFMPSGPKNESGSSRVKQYTNLLLNAGNKSIYGLLDWDGGLNKETKHIKIFGDDKRYTLENYIFDPVFLSFFLLLEDAANIEEIGFSSSDNINTVANIDQSKLQAITDLVVNMIKQNRVKKMDEDDGTIISERLNGFVIQLPKWYLVSPGHLLEESCIKAFPRLNRFTQKPDSLKIAILKKIIRLYYKLLPREVIIPFVKLQEITIL